MAQKDLKYRAIVNGANINTCDGSSISKMANSIYGTHYSAFNGPEVFERYIEQPYKHVLVGNTQKKVDQIKSKVAEKGLGLDLTHVDVPFVSVEEFGRCSLLSRSRSCCCSHLFCLQSRSCTR